MNMRRHLRALCILVTAGVTVSGYNALRWPINEVQIMSSKQDQAVQLLRLPDAEYFSFNQDRQLKLQSALAKLVNNGDSPAGLPETILAIGSPANIDVRHQNSIPVLIGHVQTGVRAWQVNLNSNLHMFVRNLSTGELSVADPLINMRRGERPLPSGGGTPPEGSKAGTLYTSVSLVNLRDKLGDKVTPGRLSVTAIVNELRSNSVAVNMQGNAEQQPKPPAATQSYVRHQLTTRAEFPTQVYVPDTGSAEDRIPIRVAIQVNAGGMIPKGPSGQTFWSFHIILIKLDDRPEIIPATVPVQEIGSPTGRHTFNAFFEIDARAAAKSPLRGNYQVYVDVGGEFFGPYPLRVS
jgi:hypothetical protein